MKACVQLMTLFMLTGPLIGAEDDAYFEAKIVLRQSVSFAFARPSLGSWLSYGLGTVNQNLPSFVVIAPKQTYAVTQVYASDVLPG